MGGGVNEAIPRQQNRLYRAKRGGADMKITRVESTDINLNSTSNHIELAVNGLALVALVKQVFFGKEKKDDVSKTGR